MKSEQLRILQTAEVVADGIWRQVVRWDAFARDTVGKQMARAGDSIGANIAEAYGRFHYGEKLQFLIHARGSLFELKYWLNRAQERELMPSRVVAEYAGQLTGLARQQNAFAADLKAQRHGRRAKTRASRESAAEHTIDPPFPLFSRQGLESLTTIPNIEYSTHNTKSPKEDK